MISMLTHNHWLIYLITGDNNFSITFMLCTCIGNGETRYFIGIENRNTNRHNSHSSLLLLSANPSPQYFQLCQVSVTDIYSTPSTTQTGCVLVIEKKSDDKVCSQTSAACHDEIK